VGYRLADHACEVICSAAILFVQRRPRKLLPRFSTIQDNVLKGLIRHLWGGAFPTNGGGTGGKTEERFDHPKPGLPFTPLRSLPLDPILSHHV
jgi:hypothetical protein